MKSTAIIAILLLLAACQMSGTMTADELSKNDIGPKPTDYQQLITTYFNSNLKDPYSAHYEFQDPIQGKLWKGAVYGGYEYGWLCTVQVNAKNSFGGYTGNQLYKFIVRDGKIQYVQGPPSR